MITPRSRVVQAPLRVGPERDVTEPEPRIAVRAGSPSGPGASPSGPEPPRQEGAADYKAVRARDRVSEAGRGQPAMFPATAAATLGYTRTAPANPAPKSAGTTCTSSPGSGACSIMPLPM